MMRLAYTHPRCGPAAGRSTPRATLALIVAAALATFTAPGLHAQAACDDVSGAWTVDLTFPGGQPQQVTVTLEQTECEITGIVKGNNETPIEDGTVEGATFTFTTTVTADGQAIAIGWNGTVDGDDVSGTLTSPAFGSVEFAGKRAG